MHAAGAIQYQGSVAVVNCCPDRRLKNGKSDKATIKASTIAPKQYKIDSTRNCVTRSLRLDPSTFRTPTSRLRPAERAVERFMKLTQANSRIKTAIIMNIRT